MASVAFNPATAAHPHYTSAKLDRVDRPLSALEFIGAGRRRSVAAAQAAAERRTQDERTAARLAGQDLDPYLSEQAVHAVDLVTSGMRTAYLGRPTRRWCIFQSEIVREQRATARLIQAWASQEACVPQLVQVRLRPITGPVPVSQLRNEHAKQVGRLRERLRYVGRLALGYVPVLWGEHHKPLNRGAEIDLHYHVIMQVSHHTDRAALEEYLGRHYSVFVAEANLFGATSEHAQALAAYVATGTARYAEQFDDAHLATYVRQVYRPACPARPAPLHRIQSLGPLRAFAGEMGSAGLHPVTDKSGKVVLAPRQPRRPRLEPAMRFTSGPTVLKIRLSWHGDELRPCVLVRGWKGSWPELAERYDLSLAQAAAKWALSSTSTTDNRESGQSPWTTHQITGPPKWVRRPAMVPMSYDEDDDTLLEAA